MPTKRKLIEVALPLEAINVASAREKSIRHGHPSTLHLWWSRKPLATCRAVLFASLVDDPSSDPDHFPTPKAQEDERRRLFDIIERLVQWENTTNESVLGEARAEIRRSTGGNPPAVLDPFCGGGSIPLEAQRLGLKAYGSDLNPVAVLITKALVEIPPKFADCAPVHPEARSGIGSTGAWRGAAGLAQDVRHYGRWMRDEAERRIGHLYPKVPLPKERGGGEATAIAWLWVRTVVCPNPACSARMPLANKFELSRKKGHEAWAVPIIDRAARTISYSIGGPHGAVPEGTVTRQGARCIVCESPVPFAWESNSWRWLRRDSVAASTSLRTIFRFESLNPLNRLGDLTRPCRTIRATSTRPTTACRGSATSLRRGNWSPWSLSATSCGKPGRTSLSNLPACAPSNTPCAGTWF